MELAGIKVILFDLEALADWYFSGQALQSEDCLTILQKSLGTVSLF